MNEDRFSIGAAVTGALFTALGVLFMLRSFDVIELRMDVVLSATVIALGIALVANAVFAAGRRPGGP